MRSKHVIGFVGGLSLVVFSLWLFRPARPESSGAEPARAVATPTAPADAVTRRASDDPAVPPRRARPSARLELTEAQQELVNAVQGHERLAQISPVSIQAYLDQSRRSAGSLLTAYHATGDPAYLSEAAAEFPDEPRVQYAMAIRPDQSPAEKRQWLERFKAAAPDNALPAYLSAREYFQQGLADTAVTELRVATTRPGFSPYVFEAMIDTQELLMADGASPAASENELIMYLERVKVMGELESLRWLQRRYE